MGDGAMTANEYRSNIKRLSWPYGAILFGLMIPGTLGAIYLSDRIAGWSSWDRMLVFLLMLPADCAPVVIACMIVKFVDHRIGLKCHCCGQSLSFGPHLRPLSRQGGNCPKCGTLVVTIETDIANRP
jgi:hypothetical protein